MTDGPPTGFATLNGKADNPDSAFVFAGPANILEKLVLARDGNSFTGTFTLTQYLPNPDGPAFDTSAGPAGPPIVGTIKACRVAGGQGAALLPVLDGDAVTPRRSRMLASGPCGCATLKRISSLSSLPGSPRPSSDPRRLQCRE